MSVLSIEQLIGQNIGGYVVKSLIGQSRFNAVYLAQHPAQQHVVALTTFRLPEQFSSAAHTRFQQRFTEEAAVLVALSHRNLLPIFGYGEQFGYSYLITPYMMNGSLANILKRREYCTAHEVLNALEQVAAGVGYAHRKGVVHGNLHLSNILVQNDGTLLIAGFGLTYMLQRRGIVPLDQPHDHLMSVAGTFLYASTSIAPEVIQGQLINQRSDIYALGIMLFEMLSGKPPFMGSSPLDTAIQHVQQPLPSLHRMRPEVPVATELVVNQALSRDPKQRFQSVSDLVEAFAQTCSGVSQTEPRQDSSTSPLLNIVGEAKTNERRQYTREERSAVGRWQLTPPIVTGKMSAISLSHQPMKGMPAPVPSQSSSTESKPVLQRLTAHIPQSMPQPPELALTQHQPVQPTQAIPVEQVVQRISTEPMTKDTDAVKTPDWWIQTSAAPLTTQSAEQSERPESFSSTKSVHEEQSKSRHAFVSTKHSQRSIKKRSRNGNRRKVVTLLATGGVAAVGVGIATKMNLVHLFPSTTSYTSTATGTTANGNQTQTGGGNGGNPQQNMSQDHTAIVVGTTELPINASMGFLNPAGGKPSILIHLPNGKYVAYERACTHQGVSVHYDSVTHKLVCPAHGAIFDPANNAMVLQGPAARPLVPVTVRVNADGTITVAK